MGFIHEGCICLQINQHVENRNRQEQREPCHQASLAGAIADSDHCPRKTRHALAGLPPTRDAGVASLRAVPSLLLDGWTAVSLFRRRRPRFKSSIRSDATFGEGDATIDVRSLRSTANRMRCFCVNITPFFLSGTHARSWARNNRGPGRCRSRGEA